MTSSDTPNVISSPESGDGHLPCGSPESPMTDLFGQAVAPASHSAQPERKKATAMSDTYGRIGLGSSESADLQRYLESRLQAQLPLDGWMQSLMIWKRKRTPALRQYCQLAVSTSRTSGTDYGLWLTPNAMDSLPPRSQEAKERQFQTTRKGRSTPATLREQVNPAMWPTPSSLDWKDSQGMTAQRKDGRGRHDQLPRLIPSNGLNAKTENCGQLNPEFVFWLMGFPDEWLALRPEVTPSRRKSQQNLSKHVR